MVTITCSDEQGIDNLLRDYYTAYHKCPTCGPKRFLSIPKIIFPAQCPQLIIVSINGLAISITCHLQKSRISSPKSGTDDSWYNPSQDTNSFLSICELVKLKKQGACNANDWTEVELRVNVSTQNRKNGRKKCTIFKQFCNLATQIPFGFKTQA